MFCYEEATAYGMAKETTVLTYIQPLPSIHHQQRHTYLYIMMLDKLGEGLTDEIYKQDIVTNIQAYTGV